MLAMCSIPGGGVVGVLEGTGPVSGLLEGTGPVSGRVAISGGGPDGAGWLGSGCGVGGTGPVLGCSRGAGEPDGTGPVGGELLCAAAIEAGSTIAATAVSNLILLVMVSSKNDSEG
ncbi:MAG TPA: hypothetical protein VLK25_05580 [Allosphingosinicella sp.]|nr:hypothetical protein [Allosphingosinicella sp.]